MTVSRERIEELVETTALAAEDLGIPVPLSPNQEDQHDSDWSSQDLPVLFQVLSTVYGPAVLVNDLRHATQAMMNGELDPQEFTTDHPDISIYVQYSRENSRVIYLLGAPGFDFTEL